MFSVFRKDKGQGGQGTRTLVGVADTYTEGACIADEDARSIDWIPDGYDIISDTKTEEDENDR